MSWDVDKGSVWGVRRFLPACDFTEQICVSVACSGVGCQPKDAELCERRHGWRSVVSVCCLNSGAPTLPGLVDRDLVRAAEAHSPRHLAMRRSCLPALCIVLRHLVQQNRLQQHCVLALLLAARSYSFAIGCIGMITCPSCARNQQAATVQLAGAACWQCHAFVVS